MTAADYMAKADRALAGAHLLLNGKDTEGACSRAYYAMFDAARAALLTANAESGHADAKSGYADAKSGYADAKSGYADAKTHRGLIAAFGQHLVLTGRIDAEFGRSLNRVQTLRMTADYIGDPPSFEDAVWAIGQAQTFIDGLRSKSIVP